MTDVTADLDRLRQAGGLAAVLDAARDGFEDMLSVLWDHIDPTEAMFIPLLTAATCAADGRDAILFAPSLPPRRRHTTPPSETDPAPDSVDELTGAIAGLCELLASRLAEATAGAADHGDQAACHDAARYARQIHDVLTGTNP
jgi:hypothetical protein